MPIYEVAQRYTGPASIIVGSDDQVVDPKYSKKYDEVYQNSELHILNGADHRFSNQYKDPAAKLASDFVKPLF